jgi:hypothetical protein
MTFYCKNAQSTMCGIVALKLRDTNVPDKRHYFPLERIEDNENRGTWISDEKIPKHSSTLNNKYDIFKYRLNDIGKMFGI